MGKDSGNDFSPQEQEPYKIGENMNCNYYWLTVIYGSGWDTDIFFVVFIPTGILGFMILNHRGGKNDITIDVGYP